MLPERKSNKPGFAFTPFEPFCPIPAQRSEHPPATSSVPVAPKPFDTSPAPATATIERSRSLSLRRPSVASVVSVTPAPSMTLSRAGSIFNNYPSRLPAASPAPLNPARASRPPSSPMPPAPPHTPPPPPVAALASPASSMSSAAGSPRKYISNRSSLPIARSIVKSSSSTTLSDSISTPPATPTQQKQVSSTTASPVVEPDGVSSDKSRSAATTPTTTADDPKDITKSTVLSSYIPVPRGRTEVTTEVTTTKVTKEDITEVTTQVVTKVVNIGMVEVGTDVLGQNVEDSATGTAAGENEKVTDVGEFEKSSPDLSSSKDVPESSNISSGNSNNNIVASGNSDNVIPDVSTDGAISKLSDTPQEIEDERQAAVDHSDQKNHDHQPDTASLSGEANSPPLIEDEVRSEILTFAASATVAESEKSESSHVVENDVVEPAKTESDDADNDDTNSVISYDFNLGSETASVANFNFLGKSNSTATPSLANKPSLEPLSSHLQPPQPRQKRRQRKPIDMTNLTLLHHLLTSRLADLQMHHAALLQSSRTNYFAAMATTADTVGDNEQQRESLLRSHHRTAYITSAREIVFLGVGISKSWGPIARGCKDAILRNRLLLSLQRVETLSARMKVLLGSVARQQAAAAASAAAGGDDDFDDGDSEGIVLSSASEVVRAAEDALKDLEAARVMVWEKEPEDESAAISKSNPPVPVPAASTPTAVVVAADADAASSVADSKAADGVAHTNTADDIDFEDSGKDPIVFSGMAGMEEALKIAMRAAGAVGE
ncbi:hypothetical protein HDU84_000563 [Entophlyctis sp. JEL0112]|nr:hypothetical protein HDU84_000563 [Entophlyctis sp. JEL0112]